MILKDIISVLNKKKYRIVIMIEFNQLDSEIFFFILFVSYII